MNNFRYKIVDKYRTYTDSHVVGWAGCFGTKYINPGILISLDDFDRLPVCKLESVHLKEGEVILRYYTDRMLGKMRPFVKLNIIKGLVYFLKPNAEHPDFETKGEQLTYLVFKEDPTYERI